MVTSYTTTESSKSKVTQVVSSGSTHIPQLSFNGKFTNKMNVTYYKLVQSPDGDRYKQYQNWNWECVTQAWYDGRH